MTRSSARLLCTAMLLAVVAPAAGLTYDAHDPKRERQRVLELVNEARATPTDCGAEGTFDATAPLVLDERLTAAAVAHSRDMHDRGELTHEGADGSTVAERVEREGYEWRRLAENIALGPRTADEVVTGWLGSDGHCANIMDPAAEHLGVGRSGTYWTQVFAAPL